MKGSRRRVSKKIGSNKGLAILLDSTYLLAVFDVGMEEVNDAVLLRLCSLALRGQVEMYYSPLSLIEIVSKVIRETIRKEEALSMKR